MSPFEHIEGIQKDHEYEDPDGQAYNITALIHWVNESATPVSQMAISDVIDLMDDKCWGERGGEGFSPNDVIEKPDKPEHNYHYKIANKADCSYPIIVYNRDDKFLVADGMHRLLRAVIDNKVVINAYVLGSLPQEARVE